MRIILTADWHFGYQGRLNDLRWAFKTLLVYCIKNHIYHIIILGDLTHDREYITHDVSNAIADLLDIAAKAGIMIICLVGNHDMFYRYRWRINSIRPFSKHLILVDDVQWFELFGRKFWCVPFIEHERTFMKVVHEINKQANLEDVLLTHIGIASAKMNMCFLVQNWNAVSFEDTIFSRVYAGHFHCTQKVGSKSWYVGSPIPFRFDEGLTEHGFFVYDVEQNEHEFIDLFEIGKGEKPPEFLTVTSDNIDDIINNCQHDKVKVLVKEEDDVDEIRKRLKKAGAISVTTVKPKEGRPEINRPIGFSHSNDIFKSWLEFDKPKHLNHDLLLGLEKEIRLSTEVVEDDD